MTDEEISAVDAFEAWWKSTKHYDKRYYETRSYNDGSGWFYVWDSTDKAWRSWSACWMLKQEAKEPTKSDQSELRDHFAGMAMQGDWAEGAVNPGAYAARATEYYEMADAMLTARSESCTNPA